MSCVILTGYYDEAEDDETVEGGLRVAAFADLQQQVEAVHRPAWCVLSEQQRAAARLLGFKRRMWDACPRHDLGGASHHGHCDGVRARQRGVGKPAERGKGDRLQVELAHVHNPFERWVEAQLTGHRRCDQRPDVVEGVQRIVAQRHGGSRRRAVGATRIELLPRRTAQSVREWGLLSGFIQV